MPKNEKYFFGWDNIKWILKEFLNMYSSKKSFFSKKRIESGVAFLIAQWGMVFFLLKKYSVMSTTDMIMWAGAEFAISGYIISHIQKEKVSEPASAESDE
jgi:hypothetical protein